MVRFMITRPFLGILLVTLTVNLLLTWVLIDRKQQVNRVKLESIARSQRDNLHNELLRLVFKIETLSALVLDSQGRIEEFERVAAALRDDNTIQAFALAPDGTVSAVFPISPANNMLIGQNMLAGALGCNQVLTARHASRLTLSGPIVLPCGSSALVGRLSLYLNDSQGHAQYWGTAAIFLRFPDVLAVSDLYMLESMHIPFGIWRGDKARDQAHLLAGSLESANGAFGVEMPLNILNTRWYIRIASDEVWYLSLESWLYVGMSVLLSLFLSTLVQRNYDLSEIRKYLEAIAYRDPLTGTLNRRGLFEDLQKRVDASKEDKFSLYYIDLNKFKAINDTYGHEAGDRVLQLFTEVVRSHAPLAHVLGRIGGDEFVLLLRGAPDFQRDYAAIEAMLKDLALGLPELNIPGPITFSMGRAVYPDDAQTADGLLCHADTAMYIEKEHARAQGDHSPQTSPACCSNTASCSAGHT
ncbi:MAG: sensor domain-containing diguanylate cyclase [Deltaproteobacteria bacterium]|nr:sensor domain-containing diguanylate cyclase [Deltaproteobacteria bacterium]